MVAVLFWIVMECDTLCDSWTHFIISLQLLGIILGWHLLNQQLQSQSGHGTVHVAPRPVTSSSALPSGGAPVSRTVPMTTHPRQLGMQMHRNNHNNNNGNSDSNFAKEVWHFYDSATQQEVYCSKDICNKFTNMTVGQTVL